MYRPMWKAAIIQSSLAFGAIFLTFLILRLGHAAAVASMGATAFIIFATPESPAAKPKNVIGGHTIGVVSGSLCSILPVPSTLHVMLACSLAVGLSLLLMVLTETQHPPAAGTALASALAGTSTHILTGVLASAIMLALFHTILKKHLIDFSIAH
ncbi:MAG TPA: HPP family protein [Candidatus Bathyarchaeota archaeon]|nr:HPP family protein [Candidatus Bathyarchaeota archaeon]